MFPYISLISLGCVEFQPSNSWYQDTLFPLIDLVRGLHFIDLLKDSYMISLIFSTLFFCPISLIFHPDHCDFLPSACFGFKLLFLFLFLKGKTESIDLRLFFFFNIGIYCYKLAAFYHVEMLCFHFHAIKNVLLFPFWFFYLFFTVAKYLKNFKIYFS